MHDFFSICTLAFVSTSPQQDFIILSWFSTTAHIGAILQPYMSRCRRQAHKLYKRQPRVVACNQRPTINWTASLQSTRLHPQYPLLKMNQPQQIQNAKMMASATVLLVGFIFVLYQSRDVTQPPQLVRSSGNLRPAASSSRTRRVSSTSLRAKTSSGCGLWHPSVGDPKTW